MSSDHQDTRDLLIAIIEHLNVYNYSDMLEGYLNPMADEFNERLGALELPLIKRCSSRGEILGIPIEEIDVDADDEEHP